MIYLLKYWKAIVLAAVLVVLAVWHSHAASQAYEQGRGAAYAEVSARLAKAAKEQAETAQKSSEDYQAEKAEREQKERVRYVEVQKIVERPVYRSSCLDSDGLRQLNAAIADGK